MTAEDFITHQQWLEQTTAEFEATSDTAALDARVLLGHCLQKPLSYLLAWPDGKISISDIQRLSTVRQRRKNGEPIAYITGSREFWSMPIKTNPDVLIPRPETELLVEWALTKIPNQHYKILELGTGSGAIAIAIGKEKQLSQILATDYSDRAIQVAKENASINHCTNITFTQGNWFECVVDSDFDLILSNPPYVAVGDPHLLKGDLPFEPISALVADDNGLSDITIIVANAKLHLDQNGWLAIEHGYNQAQAVSELMRSSGYHKIETIKDLAGIDRLTVCQWSEDHG